MPVLYLWISGEDLVFNLVDGSVDRGDQLLPSYPEGLHGILGISVLENERFLNLLVDSFQFFQVRLELVNSLLVFTQPRQLVFQGSLKCKFLLMTWTNKVVKGQKGVKRGKNLKTVNFKKIGELLLHKPRKWRKGQRRNFWALRANLWKGCEISVIWSKWIWIKWEKRGFKWPFWSLWAEGTLLLHKPIKTNNRASRRFWALVTNLFIKINLKGAKEPCVLRSTRITNLLFCGN